MTMRGIIHAYRIKVKALRGFNFYCERAWLISFPRKSPNDFRLQHNSIQDAN